MALRWIGDLSTCFLLEEGWAFRLKVNEFILKGKPGWQLPRSIAEALAVEPGERRLLRWSGNGPPHRLVLEWAPTGFVGGSIDEPMSWLEMKVDDLAFLVLREDRYSIVVRRTSEVDHGDALGTLLWSSGLDPSDSVVRGDAWRRLVRTLGGTGSTAEALTERLKKRGDKRLMPLVAPAEECVTLERNNVQWPPGWQYVLPAADCERYFCIRGVDDRVRALVGVMDGTGSLPPGLIEGDGGTLWLEASWGDESAVEAVKSLLTDPPVGLVPSAARQLWTRWVAGEHQARLAALTGSDWTVELGSGGWAYEGQSVPDLLSALEMIRPDASRPASAVQIRTSTNFPRNRLGFRDGVERLVESGVRFLRANPDTGFSAVLADGHTADGATLSELARRAAR